MKSNKKAPAGTLVYTMTIRTRSGKVIRRPNGKPFCFIAK
jgi:hypothetical protein